ncbi:cell death abnormality protein 8-like isoform X2 [Camponotus floridanus]|uniref:cell death abnormality protein 8-like isoform X2 n=1 Tax=Camponotus floridanus TaxID=104421 RepID=UPI000DC69651|nr:cell death abnormality protein 8-like isoform X2 [Camponotus floridanus]
MSSTHVVKQYEIFCLHFTIVVLILDTYSDYKVAIQYLLNGETTSFISIICLMLISSLINVLISRQMQQRGDEEYNSTDDYCKILHLITKNRLFLVIAIPLKLAPIVNYWKTSKYAIKALKYKKSGDVINESRYHKMMLKKYRDASLLRVLECYLDAAPQQILQLTLMLNSYDKINFELFSDQVFSTFLAFIYMGASMAEYNKVIRFAQEDKLNIGGIAEILQLLWHFCITDISESTFCPKEDQ